MRRNWLAVGVILLFLGTSIIPAIAQDMEKPLPASRGQWLYVGGNGPGNHTKIQDAIDNASQGDTVFVYHGTYAELVKIDKSINLLGESWNSTFIKTNGHDGIFIVADNVVVDGFTVRYFNYGITMMSNNSIISHCRIRETLVGVSIIASSNTTVSDCLIEVNQNVGLSLSIGSGSAYNDTIVNCTFRDNWHGGLDIDDVWNCTFTHLTIANTTYSYHADGIHMNGGHDNEISYCNFTRLSDGISCYNANNNKISHCDFYLIDGRALYIYTETSDNSIISSCNIAHNHIGVILYGVNHIVTLCNFSHNFIGVITMGEANNTIIKNNFIKNRIHGFFLQSAVTWESNYYDNWKGVGQKIIVGLLGIKIPYLGGYFYLDIIPSHDCDKHPAQKPYDIGG